MCKTFSLLAFSIFHNVLPATTTASKTTTTVPETTTIKVTSIPPTTTPFGKFLLAIKFLRAKLNHKLTLYLTFVYIYTIVVSLSTVFSYVALFGTAISVVDPCRLLLAVLVFLFLYFLTAYKLK